MEAFGLGPNGALLYAVQHIADNLDWVEERINRLAADDAGTPVRELFLLPRGREERPTRRCCAGRYLLIDCPGQAELFTNSEAFLRIVKFLTDKIHVKVRPGERSPGLDPPEPLPQLAAVHLVDSHHCADPSTILSASLLSLHAMTRLELPHVNVLSKFDISEQHGPLRESDAPPAEVLDRLSQFGCSI